MTMTGNPCLQPCIVSYEVHMVSADSVCTLETLQSLHSRLPAVSVATDL